MRLVNDDVFFNTLKRVKEYIKISNNPKKYKKKILINLMPSFAFKQLIIFIRLGEYLKKEGFFVDYFICNGLFNHCDMVKMNDGIDRKLMCQRCIYSDEVLNLHKFALKFERKNIKFTNNKINEIFLKRSTVRYCGDNIKFQQYEKESLDNLLIANNLNLNYDAVITLNHFQVYSIAPLSKSMNIKIYIEINVGDGDKITPFGREKETILNQNILFSNDKLLKIERYLKSRINLKNNLKIDSKKKIISFFPNLLEDAYNNSEDNNPIFDSMLDWLIESVEKLKKDFFIIIKAHPAENTWKPTVSVIDYFKNEKDLMLIPSNSNISAYDIINISDYIATYNGTVFYEGLVMEKKVVLGGKIGDFYHKSKAEYFNQFYNYKPYDYKKAMEYAYKILFTKAFKLDMIDKTLPYPHIKKEYTDEVSFKAIKDILNNSYDVNNYIDKFVGQY